MRIILDLQGCQSDSRLRGIGRYSLAFAKAIIANGDQHDVWIVLNDLFPESIEGIRVELAGLLPYERIVVMALPGPATELMGFAWRARAAELIREFAISELQPDVVHISSLFEGYTSSATTSIKLLDAQPVIALTHYDLIQFLDQDLHLRDAKTREFHLRKIEMLKQADLLLSISDYSGKEVAQHLNIPSDRVVNISTAVNERFFGAAPAGLTPENVLGRHHITRPYVMTTGIVEPRKNLEGLISAFAAISPAVRSAYQLLLVCQASDLERARLIALGRSKGLAESDLVITEFVADDDLFMLYQQTRLFVFPSFHEGFGLPAVEAMACGAAVIGSSATSLPEAIGNADALFDPADTAAMARLMERALTDESFHAALRAHGVQHARRFSWSATAAKALAAFESAHAQSLPRRVSTERPESLYDALIESVSALDIASEKADWVAAASAIAMVERPCRDRQMLVDVSVLSGFDAKSGIQRVTRAIVTQLIDSPPEGWNVRLVRVDRTARAYRYADTFHASISQDKPVSDNVDDWVDTRPGDLFLALDLCADTVPETQPWFEARRRQGVRIFFVVYDLLPVLRPEWFHDGIARVFPPWLKTIGEVSEGIACISHSVARDLKQWYVKNTPKRLFDLKIGVFHLGADIQSSLPSGGLEADAESVLFRIAAHPSFLMVGTVEPRKGYTQALAAFDLLWKKGVRVNLVVVGSPGWHQEALIEAMTSHAQMGTQLVWLQGISDEYLERVYGACSCLLAASEGEGFGLPLIEAAQKGMPIIARELPVFREVAGDAAFYFDGVDPLVLADAVKKWLDAKQNGQLPDVRSVQWLTWKESAEQLKQFLFDNAGPRVSRPTE